MSTLVKRCYKKSNDWGYIPANILKSDITIALIKVLCFVAGYKINTVFINNLSRASKKNFSWLDNNYKEKRRNSSSQKCNTKTIIVTPWVFQNLGLRIFSDHHSPTKIQVKWFLLIYPFQHMLEYNFIVLGYLICFSFGILVTENNFLVAFSILLQGFHRSTDLPSKCLEDLIEVPQTSV